MGNEDVWRLNCFGGLKVTRIGTGEGNPKVIERFRTQKTAALMALLALRGSQSRESICTLLWPDTAPETARNSLSVALSSLRRELGEDTLLSDRQRVALALHAITTDVEEFEAALAQGDFARAVEIFQGPFLPGFHDEPFLLLATEYEEKARSAFCARLDALESAGNDSDTQSALELARRAVVYFGEDERWFLATMRTHHATGDLEAALRSYERLQRWARKNGEVASETARELAKVIRREKEANASQASFPAVSKTKPTTQNSLPHTPDAELPLQWTRFFGREAERDLLRGWLTRGEKLITLSGAGGSGKTRLAIETLRETAPEISARFCFVPLASIVDADLIFPTIRDALGWSASPELTAFEQLARGLAAERWTLLLDNFEQLAVTGAAPLQTLRERLPNVIFLVTSRVLLNLPGEREFALAPLPTPLSGTLLEQMDDYPSVELFCDRANLTLTEANIEAIGALCRRMDGIPLALELAAARAHVLSPAQILERLERHPDLLRSREHGLPARHQTLRATIEWSTDLLPPELHELFLRLSVFRGGWTVESAEAVCDEPDALDALTHLRESSLVRVVENEEGMRFRMLETLREFAQEKLTPKQREQSQRRFFDYFLHLSQQAASAMQGPGQTQWLGRLDAEQDNLRAALNWAHQHDAEHGLLLATALIDFWETRLSLKEGRHWIETFLQATSLPSPTHSAEEKPVSKEWEVRARALSGVGRLAWYASDLQDAKEFLSQGLVAAQKTGNPSALIYPTHSAARLAAVSGEQTQALALGQESVRLAREAKDDALLLASLIDLGPTFIVAGNFEALAQTCNEAIPLARKGGNQHALALALYMRAIGDFYQAHYTSALAPLTESEAICRQLGARWDLMICLSVIGSVRRELGEYQLSQSAFHEALLIAREPFAKSLVIVNILMAHSYLLMRRGDFKNAAILMGGSEAFAQTIGYTPMLYLLKETEFYRDMLIHALGEVEFEKLRRSGHQLSPEATVEFALNNENSTLSRQPGNSDDPALAVRSRALSGASRLAWHNSDFAASRTLVQQGLDTARQAGDTASFVFAVAAFVRFAMTTGDTEGDVTYSRALSEEAVARSRRSGDDSLLLESLIALNYARLILNDFSGVRDTHKEAIDIARRTGEEGRLAISLTSLASLDYYEGYYDAARHLLEESTLIARRLGAPWDLIAALWTIGHVAREQNQLDVAQNALHEVFKLCHDNPAFSWGVNHVLLAQSYLLYKRDLTTDAAVALGAAEALALELNYRIAPVLRVDYERFKTLIQQALGEDAFIAARTKGAAMNVEQAIDFGLSC